MEPFFQVARLASERVWSADRHDLTIRQTLVLDSDCAATIIVSQHIDGFDMVEGVRHSLQKGRNELHLSEMKIVNAHLSNGVYELSVRIYAAGIDPVAASERINAKGDIQS